MHKLFVRGPISLISLIAFSPVAAFAARPTISEVTPTTATAGTAVTLSATVSASAAIQYCRLYVDLEDVGDMSYSPASGIASRSYTFASGGSRIAFVFCRDTDGNLGAGPNTAIWVEGAIVSSPPMGSTPPATTPPATTPPATTPPATTPPVPPASPTSTAAISAHALVKLPCAAGADVDDPCKAVYYIGTDGKRHAFPNSKTYFTWYADFSAMQEITSAQLSGYVLGKNVTYRPGARMVKFQTLNKVYAVTTGGVLRWVQTEAVARVLYGDDWNTKIDDIPDAFFANYTFGLDIANAGDYNPTSELSANATFD